MIFMSYIAVIILLLSVFLFLIQNKIYFDSPIHTIKLGVLLDTNLGIFFYCVLFDLIFLGNLTSCQEISIVITREYVKRKVKSLQAVCSVY
jgi:hypothetical protein